MLAVSHMLLENKDIPDPDDKYGRKCGEIYISHEQAVVIKCALCPDTYDAVQVLLVHVKSWHGIAFDLQQQQQQNKQEPEPESEPKQDSLQNEVAAPPVVAAAEHHNIWSESAAFQEEFITCNTEISNICVTELQLAVKEEPVEGGSIELRAIASELKTVDKVSDDEHVFEERTECSDGESSEEYKCDECDKGFTDETQLRLHTAKHDDTTKRHKCDICGATFKLLNNCQAHIKRHTQSKQFKCNFCEKTFHRRCDRDKHHNTHTGEKPHQCPICGKRFTTSRSKKDHIERHEDPDFHKKAMEFALANQELESTTADALKFAAPLQESAAATKQSADEADLCKNLALADEKITRQTRQQSANLLDTAAASLPPKKMLAISPTKSTKRDFHKYKCHICGIGFRSDQYCKRHIKHHTEQRKHKCEFCEQSFFTRHNLKRHERTHMGEKQHQCNICGREFRWPNGLKEHIKRHDDPALHKKFMMFPQPTEIICLTDAEIAPLQQQLAVSDSADNSSTVTVQAQQEALTVGTTVAAAAAISSTGPYVDLPKCLQCNKTFLNKRQLEEHAAKHKEIRRYKCPVCGVTFKDSGNCRAHVRRHDQEKKHKCDFCERRFHSSTEKQSHQLVHTGEKPFLCNFCGKKFRSSAKLTLHARQHTNERPYKCDFCEKSFFNGMLLKDHITLHTNERKFKCDICQTAFRRRNALQQHKKLHADTKEYKCQYCGKEFKQQPGLLTHLKTHTNLSMR